MLYERFLRTYEAPIRMRPMAWRFQARGRVGEGAPYVELRFEAQSRQFVAYSCRPSLRHGLQPQLLSAALTKKIAAMLPPEAIADCTRASLVRA